MPEFTISHWPFIAGSYGFMALCVLLEVLFLRRQRQSVQRQAEFEVDVPSTISVGQRP